MKKNARILSLLLSVVMVFGLMVVPAVAAENATVTISAFESDVAVGDTVVLTVELTNNPGFLAYQGSIILSDNLTFVGMSAVDENGVDYNTIHEVALDNTNKTFYLATAGLDVFTEDTVLFAVEVKVNAAGVASVSIDEESAVMTNLVDNEAVALTVNYKNATATIKAVDDSGKDDDNTNPTPVKPAKTCDKIDVFAVEAETPNAALAEKAGEGAEHFTIVMYAHIAPGEVEEPVVSEPVVSEPAGEVSSPEVSEPAGEVSSPEVSEPAGEVSSPEVSEPAGEVSSPEVSAPATEVTTPEITVTNPNGVTETPEIGDEVADCENGCVYGELSEEEIAALQESGIDVTLRVTEPTDGEYTYSVWYVDAQGNVSEEPIDVVPENGLLTFNVPYGTVEIAVVVTEVVEEVEELSDAIIIPRLLPVTVTVDEGAKINTTAKFLIAFGARRTIEITVEEGYEVADIIVNGKSVGAADSYTLKGVAKAQNIVIKTAEVVEEVIEEAITEDIAE